jgi:hypothetical protein
MTLPIEYRRSTAAERRANRSAFQILKAQVAGSQTAEKRRVKARGDDNRARAQKKIKAALAGQPIRPFSELEAARIWPAEHAQLRQEVTNRLGGLTAEERKALTANQHLLLVCFDADQLRVVAGAG